MSDPLLQNGFYLIGGAYNTLLLAEYNGRVTVESGGGVAPAPEQIWVVTNLSDHVGNEGYIRIENNMTTNKVCAKRGPGNPPVEPPERGGNVFPAARNVQDYDYALWKPTRIGPDLMNMSLTNHNSITDGNNHAMVLNIRGDKWGELDDVITWEWSGGKPNELWLFQFLHR